MHVGAETTSVTYKVRSNIAGTFTYTVNGSPKYVTLNKSSDTAAANTDYTITVTGGSNGEGSNTISNKFTPTASNNYNEKTVNYTASAVPTYLISYNANGGSGAPSNQIKVKGTNITIPSTVPTRSGYTFLGWSTSNTATSPTYTAGASYTANAAATLYAVWNDSIPPTLALSKWTYHEGWGSNGPIYVFGNVSTDTVNGMQRWKINSTTGGIIPRFYSVNGGRYYVTFDYFGGNASTAATPNDGWYTGLFYQDFYGNAMADTHSGFNYTSNGHAAAHPINTWETDTSLTVGYGVYGFDRVRFGVEADNYYGKGPIYVRNLRVWGENMRNSFYEIQATCDDNVGISTIKYISGDTTETDCINNGTAMNLNGNYYWYQVTSNGTYTVCVSDLAGNITKKTITIDKIGKLTAVYPYAGYSNTYETTIPQYYSNLCWTYDGYNQTCEPRRYDETNNTQASYLTVNDANVEDIFGYTYYEFAENNGTTSEMRNIGTDITPSPYGTTASNGVFRGLSAIQAGTNTFTFTEPVQPGEWVVIHLAWNKNSGSKNFKDIKVRLKATVGTTTSNPYIYNAVNSKYLSNFVVTSGGDSNLTLNIGTTTNYLRNVSGNFGYINIFLKARNDVAIKQQILGITFTADAAVTGAGDGIRVIKLPSTFDLSTYPFSSKFWYDSWSGTLYSDGVTPSITYAAPRGQQAEYVYIRTDDSGHHSACINGITATTNSSDTTFCIKPNYWDTDAETTRQKLVRDIQRAFNIASPGSWTDGTSDSSVQPKYTTGSNLYDCWAQSNGEVGCGFRSGNYDWSDSTKWKSCRVKADGSAYCYTGH